MPPPRYILRKVPAAEWKQWDQFVNEHPHGHFLQSWGWGELKAHGGWHPLRLALLNEEQQIAAAAQVLCRGANHLPLRTGHLAYIPKGPVIDWSQPLLCQDFFTQLNAHLRQQGALALRMEPDQELMALEQLSLTASSSIVGEPSPRDRHDSLPSLPDSPTPFVSTLPLLLNPAPPVQPVRTILLDLTLDEATLLANMKEKWRYNLRLAERKGVKIREAQTPEDVQAWYTLMQTTSERDQFGIHTLDYYLRAWQIFAPRQQARLFLAEYDGQMLAGIFVTLFARQGTYLYGASSDEHRNLMPNYLLQWEAIRWAKQQGATQYDFGGISATDNEHDPLAGVYRFKRGWGGKVVRFVGCYEHIYHPVAMKLAKRYVAKLV